MSISVDWDSPNGAAQTRRILERETINLKKMAAFEYYRQVTIATPVDTGRMRWGWFISISVPSSTVPPAANYAIPSITNHIEGAIDNISIADTLYLTNNVPYVVYVNNGTRKMAARRFVEVAMTRTQNSLRGLANLKK